MKKLPLGIITALPAEAKSLSNRRIAPMQGTEIRSGIWLCLTGMGSSRLYDTLRLLHQQGVSHIVNWGVAGALRPAQHSGELLLPAKLTDGEQITSTSACWRERIGNLLQASGHLPCSGTLHSADRMIRDPKERSQLAQNSTVAAIDMEAHALAIIAHDMGMELIVIKTIADNCHNDIPDCVCHHIDAYGNPKFPQFALNLLRNPAQLQPLLSLALAFRRALQTLADIRGVLLENHFCLP